MNLGVIQEMKTAGVDAGRRGATGTPALIKQRWITRNNSQVSRTRLVRRPAAIPWCTSVCSATSSGIANSAAAFKLR
jgi:hypothetical protein